MSRLQQLLDSAYQGRDLQERLYGSFPFEIARDCGSGEVDEILARLDRLQREKDAIEEWDGDSRDGIWRMQRDFSALLERLTHRYAKQIAKGLASECLETRFWVAMAFSRSPSPEVVTELAEYLLDILPDHHRACGHEALQACKDCRSSPTG
ncbi:hypothetical protein [Microbulbifer litoralis]|uniref:hypothetical protein n=1 Tax=Microbulbifer litoralis TaxID=2933965 RepID=UPI002027AB8B|nr:hypothetical protein [Microbulbifer sp. GX H0434]